MGICKEMVVGFSKLLNEKQAKYYDWLLKEGKEFSEKDKTEMEVDFKPKKRCCFYNAQYLALFDDNVEYYEGWGTSKGLGIPLEHAFNVKDGKVLDLTWKEKGEEYFGIRIPKEYIQKRWAEDKCSDAMVWRYFYDEIFKRGEENAKSCKDGETATRTGNNGY